MRGLDFGLLTSPFAQLWRLIVYLKISCLTGRGVQLSGHGSMNPPQLLNTPVLNSQAVAFMILYVLNIFRQATQGSPQERSCGGTEGEHALSHVGLSSSLGHVDAHSQIVMG